MNSVDNPRYPVMKTATLQDLQSLKTSGEEFALIDVRERGHYGYGHLLLSTHVAYSDLELRMPTLVPRSDTRIIVLDLGGDVAESAVASLAAMGYRDVAILRAGPDDWRAAGFEVFVGDDAWPKGFGEIVESVRHTPNIEPDRLREMMDRGEKFILLDGRSEDEFRTNSVPGAISVPNGELLWRVGDIVPDDKTVIVVSCAGRTRSIVGAQTLIDAGMPNPVFALRGGTQGWRMAGHALDTGKDPSLTPVSHSAVRRSIELSKGLQARTAVPSVTGREIAAARAAGRTVYLIDIRTRAEFEAGHVEGAMHIAGGQLVQTITRWCATKNAIVAVTEEAPHVRATTTAYWLRQMGWDARVADRADLSDLSSPASVAAYADGVRRIGIAELRAMTDEKGVLLIDAGPGMDYRQGHLPEAVWMIRPLLREHAGQLRAARSIAVYADSDGRAGLAAAEVSAIAPQAEIVVVAGGKAAWTEAGLALQDTPDVPADADCIDYLFWTHDRLRGNDEASAEYFRWELALPGQLARDGSVKFSVR